MSRIHHIMRNILIISKIRTTPYITFDELKKQIEKEFADRHLYDVGISDRTLQRDFDYIRTEFSIGINYDKRRRGYYIEEDGYNSILDNFMESYDTFNALNGKLDITDIVLTERHSPTGANLLSTLIESIKNSLLITFTYKKFGETLETVRKLEPYLLKEFRRRWYIIGRTPDNQSIKIFGLDRISNLNVPGDSFQKDTSLDLTGIFKDSFGIYSSETQIVEDVILSFSKSDGNYLKSLPLHHSQIILKDEDDEFIIQLRLCVTYDFIMEILSRSWSLKVISPVSLRERVSEIWQSAVERNK